MYKQSTDAQTSSKVLRFPKIQLKRGDRTLDGYVSSGTIRKRGYGPTKEAAQNDAEAKLYREAVIQAADKFVVTEKIREHRPFPYLRSMLTTDRPEYSYTFVANLYNRRENSVLKMIRLHRGGITSI